MHNQILSMKKNHINIQLDFYYMVLISFFSCLWLYYLATAKFEGCFFSCNQRPEETLRNIP